jgi:aspartyl-tRNA(Asn)/glutamyl-tRNA(Gln) amidotransferase subunit C
MSRIDLQTVHHIAKLARLSFDAADEERFTRDLARIVDYVDVLERLPADAPQPSEAARATPMRADETRPSPGRDALLANAPETDGGHLRVPAILGGGGGGAAH